MKGLYHQRQILARLIAARVDMLDPAGRIAAAREASRRQFLEHGRMITGDEAKRRRYPLDELDAFLFAFETLALAVVRSGGSMGRA